MLHLETTKIDWTTKTDRNDARGIQKLASTRLSFVFRLLFLSFAASEECGLSKAGLGLEAESMISANQAVYLQSALESCVVHESSAGDVLRLFRNAQSCPKAWAISCLDHFNCEDILHDVSEPLRAGLVSLGFDDIIMGRASTCLKLISSCGDRQHLILNANLMTTKWAGLLPRTVILVNLEQLVAYTQPKAVVAAYVAAKDTRGDATVISAGEVSLKHALKLSPNAKVLGVTVDDYRGFIALDPVTANYPWLEYSYRNMDLTKDADHPCVFLKPIGVSIPPVRRGGTFRGEIDFVHIGGIYVPRRARVFTVLKNVGWRTAIIEGYFFKARDEILRRTTIGLNIHRHENRHVAEVVRLLSYAVQGMLIVSEYGNDDGSSSAVGDVLLESELKTAILFVPYLQLANCASALLQPNLRASNATERLTTNAAKLVHIRQEAKLLAPAVGAMFPNCHFQSTARPPPGGG